MAYKASWAYRCLLTNRQSVFISFLESFRNHDLDALRLRPQIERYISALENVRLFCRLTVGVITVLLGGVYLSFLLLRNGLFMQGSQLHFILVL